MVDELTSNISRRRNAARDGAASKYAERRAEIVKAAAKVFGERGFDNTSLQDVAHALGMNRATLYYYVESKEELFHDVVLTVVQANVDEIEQIGQSERPADEKLRAIIAALLRSYSNNFPYMYVWLQEDMGRLVGTSDGPSQELLELSRRYQVAVEQILGEGIASGTLAEMGSTRVVAFAILGMVNWTHRWFRPQGLLNSDEVASIFSRIVLDGLVVGDMVGGSDDKARRQR